MGPVVAAAWIGENEAQWYALELLRISGVSAALCARACTTRAATTILERTGRETHIKEAMESVAPSDRLSDVPIIAEAKKGRDWGYMEKVK